MTTLHLQHWSASPHTGLWQYRNLTSAVRRAQTPGVPIALFPFAFGGAFRILSGVFQHVLQFGVSAVVLMVRLGCRVWGDPTELKRPSHHILSKVRALNMMCPRGEVEVVDPITRGQETGRLCGPGIGGMEAHEGNYKRGWPVGLGGAQWLRGAGRVKGGINELILWGGSLREGFIGKMPEGF